MHPTHEKNMAHLSNQKWLYSLYIPRAETTTTVKQVCDVFNDIFQWEVVERVDITPILDDFGVPCYTIAVHMYQDRYPVSANRFYNELIAKTEGGRNEPLKVYAGTGERWNVYLYNKQKESSVKKALFVPMTVCDTAPGLFRSICIPQATASTSEVRNVFSALLAGDYIDRIDAKEQQDSKGKYYLTLYVHFYQDRKPTQAANKFFVELYAMDAINQPVKVVAALGDQWKVFANKVKPQVCVMTDEEQEEYEAWRATRQAQQKGVYRYTVKRQGH